MHNPFTNHPHKEGMTYGQHWRRSMKFFTRGLVLSLAALVHGFFPFIFEVTFSRGIKKLADGFAAEQAKCQKKIED